MYKWVYLLLPGFILRLCKLVFCEAPPPSLLDLRGVDEFLREISTLVLCSSTFLPWDLRSWRFFVFELLPWALRSQGLFCLRLFAHKDFYVFEFLPWALCSQGLFCLRLFAHKDFVINLVGSKAKGSEAPIRDCVPCLLLSSVITCFMRRWLPSSLGEEG